MGVVTRCCGTCALADHAEIRDLPMLLCGPDGEGTSAWMGPCGRYEPRPEWIPKVLHSDVAWQLWPVPGCHCAGMVLRRNRGRKSERYAVVRHDHYSEHPTLHSAALALLAAVREAT